MPSTVDTTDAGDSVPLRKLSVSLTHRIEFRSTGIDLIERCNHQLKVEKRCNNPQTSDVSFFATESARCARKLSSETINASPFESGGSWNPRCFCFSLKLASIERYKVFSQLVRNFNTIETRESKQYLPICLGRHEVLFGMGASGAFNG